ncbi:uncharacterized protein LOC135503558 isoform X1 [Lineus longissimus]|uniref:uncharacterized protein LOC135489081 n=1 Tax=Lineus longissimus TaxID=88925 RepID=UPI002B4C426E
MASSITPDILSYSEQKGHDEPAEESGESSQGSEHRVKGEPIRPIPRRASAWRAMNAEDLGIFWCREMYGYDEIFEKARVQHVDDGCGIAGWENLDKLVSLYSKYMDNVFRCSPAEIKEVNLIMTRSECAKEADLMLVRDVCDKLKENISRLTLPETSRICATQMMMAQPSPSTDFNACKLLVDTRLNPGTLIFLQRFESILLRFLKGKKPSEINYQTLFAEFASIFIITFCPGDMQQMDIFGKKVTSTPDLRYVKCKDQDVLVATIAEVKKMPKIAGGPPEKRRRLIDEDISDDSDDDDEEEDSFLSDKLRGQHAAELLLEVSESILPIHEKKRHVLGLIIQGTNVCLTGLEIDEDHFKQLQEPVYKELKDEKAMIYHTRSYDMFIKEDRHHLIKILLTLVKLADNRYLMHLLYPQDKL